VNPCAGLACQTNQQLDRGMLAHGRTADEPGRVLTRITMCIGLEEFFR
jgi:hypothetical protein